MSKTTIKKRMENWIKQQKRFTRFRARTIHRIVGYSVSRSTINSHLKNFELNGLIAKDLPLAGKNQTWRVK